jgi:ADP-ribosylglycohydrolase
MPLSKTEMMDRARAALIGGALGDAMGMPTQLLSAEQIAARYGHVEDFVAPEADHPVSKGLEAGTITDDTEQTLLLAKVLLSSPVGFDHHRWIEALVEWEDDIRRRGGYDLLGPSTKRAIEAIRNGMTPEQAGRYGDTNGAAMRIAPVGIMAPPSSDLITRVAETCRATHNTSIAISAASAVAMVISSGLDGMTWRDAVAKAADAARAGAAQGVWIAGGQLAARIELALDLAAKAASPDDVAKLFAVLGSSVASQESVPSAFAALALADGDCWKAAVIAANLGGDTDTIGAIACSMAGACSGMQTLPQDKIAKLRGIDLGEVDHLIEALVTARMAADAGGGDG